MPADLNGRLIAAAVAVIRDNADELTKLDQAIGDGDHGVNMNRGFDAIADIAADLAPMTLPAALQKAGMTLVMKIGGASGPLYGSLLMAMGKAVSDDPAGPADAATMLHAGVDAVRKRGKSDCGEKTMLDVLVPVTEVLQSAQAESADVGPLLSRLRTAAAEGLESTRPMQATKGRASFLGARSVGHLDPGARSSQLLVGAVCDVLENMT